MEDKKIVAIIPQYCRAELTKKAVCSMMTCEYQNKDFVVVDDCSPDDAFEKARNEIEATVIRTPRNLHLAGALNCGVKRALEMGADYMFVVGSDAEMFSRDFFSEIVRCFESDPKIGLVGVTIYNGKKQLCWGEGAKDVMGFKLSVSEGFALSKEAFSTIGFFNERLAFGFEDLDVTLRVQRAGMKVAIAKDAVFHHVGNATHSKKNRLLFEQRYLRIRNIIMVLRHYGKGRSALRNIRYYAGRSLATWKLGRDALVSLRMLECLLTIVAIVAGTVSGFLTPWDTSNEVDRAAKLMGQAQSKPT